MNRPDQLEVHVAHACNYSCESCSHFSQFHVPGMLSLEIAEEWYKTWSLRLNPRLFTLLGGEPTINPKLAEHVDLAARYWPRSKIRVTTNGTLLHRHSELPKVLSKIPHHVLQLSKHYRGVDFDKQFTSIVALCQQWKNTYGINYVIRNSFANWTRRYTEEDRTIHPFTDNNPRQSWVNCSCRKCVELHDGRLWKCPIVAYLFLIKNQLNLSEEWLPYLTYKSLDPNCSDLELDQFLTKEEEPICGMCPAYSRPFIKPDPRR